MAQYEQYYADLNSLSNPGSVGSAIDPYGRAEFKTAITVWYPYDSGNDATVTWYLRGTYNDPLDTLLFTQVGHTGPQGSTQYFTAWDLPAYGPWKINVGTLLCSDYVNYFFFNGIVNSSDLTFQYNSHGFASFIAVSSFLKFTNIQLTDSYTGPSVSLLGSTLTVSGSWNWFNNPQFYFYNSIIDVASTSITQAFAGELKNSQFVQTSPWQAMSGISDRTGSVFGGWSPTVWPDWNAPRHEFNSSILNDGMANPPKLGDGIYNNSSISYSTDLWGFARTQIGASDQRAIAFVDTDAVTAGDGTGSTPYTYSQFTTLLHSIDVAWYLKGEKDDPTYSCLAANRSLDIYSWDTTTPFRWNIQDFFIGPNLNLAITSIVINCRSFGRNYSASTGSPSITINNSHIMVADQFGQNGSVVVYLNISNSTIVAPGSLANPNWFYPSPPARLTMNNSVIVGSNSNDANWDAGSSGVNNVFASPESKWVGMLNSQFDWTTPVWPAWNDDKALFADYLLNVGITPSVNSGDQATLYPTDMWDNVRDGIGGFYFLAGPIFPDDWQHSFKIKIKTPSNVPVVITKDSLKAQIFDAAIGAIEGGDDIRFSSDVAGANQLACEIVDFHKAPNQFCEIIVNAPMLEYVYIWYGCPTATMPSRDSTYGSEAVWNSDHIGVWHCDWDGTPGGQLPDSTTNQLHLTAENGLTAESNIGNNEGLFGGDVIKSISTETLNTRFYHTDTPVLNPTNSFSIFAIIKPALTDVNWKKWVHKGRDSVNFGSYQIQNGLNIGDSKTIEFQISKQTNYYKDTELGIPDEYYCIVGVFNKSTQMLTMYVDGVHTESIDTGSEDVFYDNYGFAFFGRGLYGLNLDPSSHAPIGAMDDVRLLNVAVDDDYVSTLNDMVFHGADFAASEIKAMFSVSSIEVYAGDSVSFIDLTTGFPETWAWNFGDSSSSSAQNPVHTYTDDGVYTVSLLATGELGSDTETKVALITVTLRPPLPPSPYGKYMIELEDADLSYIGDAEFSVYLTTGRSYMLDDYVLTVPNLQTNVGIWIDENNDNVNDVDADMQAQLTENVDYIIQNKMIEFVEDIVEKGVVKDGGSLYCRWADIIERSIYSTYGTLVKMPDHIRYNQDTVSGKAAISALLKSLQSSSSIQDYQRALNIYYGLPVAPQKCRVEGLYESYEYAITGITDNVITLDVKPGEKLHNFIQVGTKLLVTKNNVEVKVTVRDTDSIGIITLDNSSVGNTFAAADLKIGDTLNVKLMNRFKVDQITTVTTIVDGSIIIMPPRPEDVMETYSKIKHIIQIVQSVTNGAEYPEILLYGTYGTSTNYDGIYHITDVKYYDANKLQLVVYNPDNDDEPRYNDYLPSSAALLEYGSNFIYGGTPESAYKDDPIEGGSGSIDLSVGYVHISWPTHKFLLLRLEDGTYFKAYIDAPVDTIYDAGDFLNKYDQICRSVSVANNSILPDWNQFDGFHRYNGLNATSDIVEAISINQHADFGSYFPGGYKLL